MNWRLLARCSISALLLLGSGCGSEVRTDPRCTPSQVPAAAPKYQYEITDLQFPKGGLPMFADDVDGDGRLENGFANFVAVITSLMAGLDLIGLDLNVQHLTTNALTDGRLSVLINLQGADPGCALALLGQGSVVAPGDEPPKLPGRYFSPAVHPARLYGELQADDLATTPTWRQIDADEAAFTLRIPLDRVIIDLPIRGLRMQARRSPDKATLEGRLSGVLLLADLQQTLAVDVARELTALINAMPMETQGIVRSLERPEKVPESAAKCMVDDDCCSKKPLTCKILPQELLAFEPIQDVLLRPDVQATQDKRWGPIPGGANLDAISLGLGFTARQVPAQADFGALCTADGVCQESKLPPSAALRAIWGAHPKDIWAVGDAGGIYRWNGLYWRAEPRVTQSRLQAVWGTGINDVWAAGRSNTVLHWDGRAWSPPETVPMESDFTGIWIAAEAPQRVWFTGLHGIYQREGKGWTTMQIARDSFIGIHGVGPDDLWACGSEAIYHSERGLWAASLTRPAQDFRGCRGIHAVQRDLVVAASLLGTVWHRDSAAWSRIQIPGRVNDLWAVWSNDPADLWAVGDQALVLHVQGQTLAPLAIPDGALSYEMHGLWGQVPGDVWIAGASPPSGGTDDSKEGVLLHALPTR